MTLERELYRKFKNESQKHEEAKAKFKIGDKVRSSRGNIGTIKEIMPVYSPANSSPVYGVDFGYGLVSFKEDELSKADNSVKESKELTVYDAMKKLDKDPRIDRCSVTKNSEQNLYVYLNADNIPDIYTIQDVEATVKQVLDDMELSNHFEVIAPKLDESVELNYKEFTDEITSYLKDKGFQVRKSVGDNKEFLKKDKQEPCYVHIIKDSDQKKIVMYYETPKKGEKALTSFSINNTKEKAIQLAKSALERKLGQKLNESVESDFNTEVARRKFNELCKRIGSALANDNVKWVEQDPGNFDAWIEALTFLRTAMAANKDSAFIDAVNNAEYALDKDRD